MDDNGRLLGAMKLDSDGMYPKWLLLFGTEKSSIWLFMIKPKPGIISLDPQLRLGVLVSEIAMPLASAADR
jgi:hypothetical protein